LLCPFNLLLPGILIWVQLLGSGRGLFLKWPVPINNISARILFESGGYPIIQKSCYQGSSGSKNTCDTSQLQVFKTNTVKNNEGVTIAIGFEKGVVDQPERIGGQVNKKVKPASPYEIPIKIMIVLGGILSLAGAILLYRINREPKPIRPIVAWYEPPYNLPPIVLGTLIDTTTDMKDITAQIISLAQRGYLSITRKEEKKIFLFKDVDYFITVTKDASDLVFEGDSKYLHYYSGTQTLLFLMVSSCQS
jgi:hypothetical protein